MAYNTKAILVDVNGKPIPQYFDPITDEYKPLLGAHGAARSMLYGPDGNPISDTNKLPVRAADLETLIGALNDSAVTNPANAASVIAALKGLLSVVGKEATLGQILSALAPLATESTLSSLASAVAKETTLAQVLSTLGALATETTLDGVKSAVDTLAGTVADGAQKVALSGSILHTVSVVVASTIAPQETYQVEYDLGTDILVDEWWITFTVTAQVLSPIDNISLDVAYSRTQGSYSSTGALVWSRTFGKSSGLVTSGIFHGHLSGMPENRPMARYMRLRWTNNHASTAHVLRSVQLMARVPKGATAPIQLVTT